jgi:hypothetical protein
MTIRTEELNRTPKIQEIENLQDLKGYACAKVQHVKDWYLKCVDCSGLKNCKVGQQAVKLVEESTAAKKAEETANPKTSIRDQIEQIFSQKEPVKALLESAGNIRPQSIYGKVNLWRKNYPDLEEKYHMLEKVRFLWTRPWNTMHVSDILKKLYPGEGPEHDFDGKYAGIPVVGEKEAVLMNEDISLEDFLKENTVKFTGEKHAEPVLKAVTGRDASVIYSAGEACSTGEVCPTGEAAACGGDSVKLEDILEKLRKNIADYEQKIREAKNQIEAVLTVQKLMQNGF